jgi:hypothetical protein
VARLNGAKKERQRYSKWITLCEYGNQNSKDQAGTSPGVEGANSKQTKRISFGSRKVPRNDKIQRGHEKYLKRYDEKNREDAYIVKRRTGLSVRSEVIA